MSPDLALLARVETMVKENSGTLIDVRNPEEVKDGKIGNAINVPRTYISIYHGLGLITNATSHLI